MLKKIAVIVVVLVVVVAAFVFYARRTPSSMHLRRVLNAPIEKVWGLWTDPEAMKLWWSPKDFTAPVIKSDFRVGGNFLLSMKAPKGEMFWNTGTYKEIIPFKKIVSSLSFSDETGRVVPPAEVPVPGVWPEQIIVTVEFKDLGGKTEVTIQEDGIPLIMKMMARMGWDQQFDKFQKLLK